MSVEALVRDYYAALRAEEPLEPYFRSSPDTVKYGLSETLTGAEEVAAALRAQTERTTDWQVDSRNLRTGVASGRAGDDGADEAAPVCGWFADDVFMAWTDTERRVRYEFDTRWTGTVVDGAFAAMHVSTAEAL